MLSTQVPLIFINISKTNYLLINHLICTTPDTEQIVILILHFLTFQKLKNVIPKWNSLPNSLKNCTSKFTFKRQIKICIFITVPIVFCNLVSIKCIIVLLFFLSVLSVYRLVLWAWGLRTDGVYITRHCNIKCF